MCRPADVMSRILNFVNVARQYLVMERCFPDTNLIYLSTGYPLWPRNTRYYCTPVPVYLTKCGVQAKQTRGDTKCHGAIQNSPWGQNCTRVHKA